MTGPPAGTTVELRGVAPWDGAALFAFLSKRAVPGLNRVDGPSWIQSLRVGRRQGWVRIDASHAGPSVALQISPSLVPVTETVRGAVRRALDLDADAATIRQQLSADTVLAPSLASHPGLRVPGSIDAFEMALRAVLGQQVSVAGATTLFGRLVERFGEPLAQSVDGIDRLVPDAERLASVSDEDIAAIGIPRSRARTLKALAAAVASGALDLGAPVPTARAGLARVPGIGPWTVEYVAMRALRDGDAFPVGDVGVRRALPGLSPTAILERAEGWRPWRAYAAMHLWSLPVTTGPRGRADSGGVRRRG